MDLDDDELKATRERFLQKPKYIASCSFGKDSLAMIIKIKELRFTT